MKELKIKNITYENIKEISLVTKYVFMLYDENAYTDLLRVSKGWISYKRTNWHTKKEICSWSYKSSSDKMKEKYLYLISTLNQEYQNPTIGKEMTDCGSFNIRITFNDDSSIDFHKMGDFHLVGYDAIATAFLDLIPKEEPYPDLLTKHVTYEEEQEESTIVNETQFEDPVAKLFKAVRYLHEQGYEKLRIMSYYSPSGFCIRCELAAKDSFDNKTGFVLKDYNNPVYKYSSGGKYWFFNNKESFEGRSESEIGDRLLIEYPELARQCKGNDPEYVKWFKALFKYIDKGVYPYAFMDYGYDIFSSGHIMLTNEEYIEYAPPGGYVMDKKAKIKIVLGDITNEKTDAIVNAANKELMAGGGVCGAIFEKAGYKELQEECVELSPIKTGEAVCTSGYNLFAKYIIHAAGPIYRGESSAPYLKNAYINSLKVAEEKKLESIAFPSISTGIYGYPLEEAARIALDAIMSFDYQSIRLVRIVCFNQATYQTYLKEYEDTLKEI